MDNLKLYIEALIFSADQAIPLEEIKSCLQNATGMDISEEEISNSVNEIRVKYSAEAFSFELAESGGGYQFLTKPQYHSVLVALMKQKQNRSLSNAALETLAIIAYKQPVTKTEIEQIRGVNCDHTVQKLLERELIVIQGRSEEVGKPLLLATSKLFMDYFGINSLQDLPKLKDIHKKENEIGSPEEQKAENNE